MKGLERERWKREGEERGNVMNGGKMERLTEGNEGGRNEGKGKDDE